MRFTRLRLNGFKSFVDPTDLVIHPGLTGVVGPNGCGKSNLLEAMRWVMGENRPTAMRGGGMEDVIFAGAATRGRAAISPKSSIIIDNSDRLAPSGFNDQDQIEIVRRITRDAGSAYKANSKDVRARDIQMLFADASTGAQSPALVRQGQIAELINAKPKNRRRILEEAAGISGLYQRRHEAELRLQATETNLARVDDVIEQLAQQLATLARQARQAARYREIGAELRQAEGMLLFRRWREADEARAEAEAALRERVVAAAQAEAAAQAAGQGARAGRRCPAARCARKRRLRRPSCSGLLVQRDQLADQEAQAQARIETLKGRIEQLSRDMEREAGLNRDAGETIARLDWEQEQIARAQEGHDERLAEAAELAREAGAILTEREGALSRGDRGCGAAGGPAPVGAAASGRHAHDRAEGRDRGRPIPRGGDGGGRGAGAGRGGLCRGGRRRRRRHAALAADTEAALAEAEAARAETQGREAEARAARSEAEGEANALRAEVAALGRLMDRETHAGTQVLDRLTVAPGYEKALGAALADDLRAPEIGADGRSGWAGLPDYDAAQPLPEGVAPLSDHVAVPDVLRRRIAQIGLVARGQGRGLAGGAAARSAAGQPRGRPLALGRVPRRGRGCALGGGAAVAAVEPAGGAEARPRGCRGAGRGRAAGA